jgi:flagellar hook-associated protein 3 FlgL
MRISTAAMHNAAVEGMLSRQTDLARTQTQMSTGKSIVTPSDDPIGAVHILELQRAQTENEQYGRNANAALARMNSEEQALADITVLLQRVRELSVAANNAPIDAVARGAIATELTERVQSLLDIANRRDGAGDFLFSGYATSTQPFARNGAGNVTYSGDQGQHTMQIGPTQRVVDSHSGDAVFQRIVQGNGTFVTGASSTNTGTGIIDQGAVLNRAAWVPDDYTLSFTSATTWEVTNGVPAVVATGTYTPGVAIAFNGIQVSVSGAPAAGDSFSVDASGREDIFTTVDNLVAALRTANDTQSDRAQLTVQINTALAQLDQAENHVMNVRAEVGARLASLDDVSASREAFEVELARNLSELQDLDYAEAISRMNRQLLGLQAAQESYTRIAQLSLFSFL